MSSPNHVSVRWASLALTAVLTLAGCEGESTSPAGPAAEGVTISLAREASGHLQVALRGTELPEPLRVEVRRGGLPASGVGVRWELVDTTSGAAIVPEGETDERGIATARVRLGARATVVIAASIPSGQNALFLATSESPTIDFPDGVGAKGTVGQALAAPVAVRLRYHGEPLPGVWLEGTGSGGVEVSGPTDALGRTEARLTLDTLAGIQTVEFRSRDYPSDVPGQYRATVAPDAPALLEWGELDGGVAGDEGLARLTVRDRWRNTIEGVAVTWRVAAGDASLTTPVTTSTNLHGVTVAHFTARGSDQQVSIAARAGSLPEIASPEMRVWDLRYRCLWECDLAPSTLTRSAGDTIRFDSASGACTFDSPVPGLAEHMPSEFTIESPGSYDFTCHHLYYGSYYSAAHGSIVITP